MRELPMIAIIDDNPCEIELLIEALEEAEFMGNILQFSSGESFLTHQTTTSRYPALTLLDLHMPGDTGPAILERLRNEGMYFPVVIFTSSWSQTGIMECYKRGANAVVLKPVHFDELVNLCKELCSFWLERVEVFE